MTRNTKRAALLALLAPPLAAQILPQDPAVAQPLPQPKVGQCPSGYTDSGGFCAPTSGTTRDAVPKPRNAQCPTGWVSQADYCLSPPRGRR